MCVCVCKEKETTNMRDQGGVYGGWVWREENEGENDVIVLYLKNKRKKKGMQMILRQKKMWDH